MFDHLERTTLATLPTPLERGPLIGPGEGTGPRLWVKRDDLTGLGGGGNKARKLEFLCGDALACGSRSLVTVGAAQSNHCRMTAAAGARLGLDVHLVLSGEPPGGDPGGAGTTGNQLLSTLFGAQFHYTGGEESHWGELEIAREALTDELRSDGLAPYSIPIGGTTPVGALGYAAQFVELMGQCRAVGIAPRAIVFTTSSGGTHAGLLAGRAAMLATDELAHEHAPDIIGVGVAKGVNLGLPDVAELGNATLDLMDVDAVIDPDDVEVDARWLGDDYGRPTAAGDDAIRWAAGAGGWLLDRTYTGKGLSGMRGMVAEGRFPRDADVVFIHTGGWPALFAPGGSP